ncbi:MarR family winged helix-turn-helix transcriptional regulator [Cellulosilyticum sp. I15G10I2]|uniref:MarR family winged helix-turn-helix transcriptional regulator n=1 Tax=Cellulosilyticum sp. I15G10I2 TaxID=1892843 RepID=UPI00085C591B|nr:MarR family transcriptional regulator [Cellulosilyticum sp. I15G10I2]
MDLQKIKLLRENVEKLQLNMNWRLKEELSCCGITLAQCQILTALENKKEVCIAQLAEALGVDSSTLSRTTNRMVEAGLIDRIANSSDRRYVSLTLTSQGEELYHYIKDRDLCYYKKILGLIPEDKREQVIESLTLVAEALKSYKQ